MFKGFLVKNLCDRCLHQLGDNEDMFAFKLIDDEGVEKIFKGHKGCLDEIIEILGQIYKLEDM